MHYLSLSPIPDARGVATPNPVVPPEHEWVEDAGHASDADILDNISRSLGL